MERAFKQGFSSQVNWFYYADCSRWLRFQFDCEFTVDEYLEWLYKPTVLLTVRAQIIPSNKIKFVEFFNIFLSIISSFLLCLDVGRVFVSLVERLGDWLVWKWSSFVGGDRLPRQPARGGNREKVVRKRPRRVSADLQHVFDSQLHGKCAKRV